MKKLILLLTGVVLSVAGFAQFSVGLQGTGNLASAQIKSAEDLDYKKKMKAMPGAGVVVQYAFSKQVALRSGANYLQNGVSVNVTFDQSVNLKATISNSLHYVQVPLTFLYTVPISRLQLFAGAGGYYNYGISGKTKSKLTHTMPDGHESVEIEESKAFDKEEDGGGGLNRSDYGVTALAGIRFSKVFVNVGYQLSLANIGGSDADDTKYKNRGLQLTIGYFF